jgi:hypothetical protein
MILNWLKTTKQIKETSKKINAFLKQVFTRIKTKPIIKSECKNQ